MNPWMSADLVEARVRDLRAAAARSRAGRSAAGRAAMGHGREDGGAPDTFGPAEQGGRPSLALRAVRALRGHRLRPA